MIITVILIGRNLMVVIKVMKVLGTLNKSLMSVVILRDISWKVVWNPLVLVMIYG